MELGNKENKFNRNVIFREVESTSRNEDVSKEKELEKSKFKLKNEGLDSFEIEE